MRTSLTQTARFSAWAFIGMVTLAECVSESAQRVMGRFTLLPTMVNSSAASVSNCPFSFDFTSINSYKYINPSNESNDYDGILWKNLIVDGNRCTDSNDKTMSTYFEPATPSDLSVNGPRDQPWFLLGWDNSNLNCPPYQANYPNQYFFTDDLPGFRDYLDRENFLPETGVGRPFRGDIYLFTRGPDNSNFEVTNPCVYLKEFTSDENEGDPELDSSPNSDPACLSGMTHVALADGSVKPASSLMLGDEVQHALNGPTNGVKDTVLSFSHRDALAWALFISLTIQIEGGLYNYTYAANQRRRLVDKVRIQLTPDHLVPVFRGTMTRAAELRIGDKLVLLQGEHYGSQATISQITKVRSQGVYAPIMLSGYIVLEGGVVVSCYTNAVGEIPSHALLAPVRALHVAGLEMDWCPFVDVFRKLILSSQIGSLVHHKPTDAPSFSVCNWCCQQKRIGMVGGNNKLQRL